MDKKTFGYPEKAVNYKYLTIKFNVNDEEENKLFEELNGVISDYKVKKLIEIINNSGNRPGKLTEHEKKLFDVIELMVVNLNNNTNSSIKNNTATPHHVIQEKAPPKKFEEIPPIKKDKQGGFMNDDVDLSGVLVSSSSEKEKIDYNKILDEIGDEKFGG